MICDPANTLYSNISNSSQSFDIKTMMAAIGKMQNMIQQRPTIQVENPRFVEAYRPKVKHVKRRWEKKWAKRWGVDRYEYTVCHKPGMALRIKNHLIIREDDYLEMIKEARRIKPATGLEMLGGIPIVPLDPTVTWPESKPEITVEYTPLWDPFSRTEPCWSNIGVVA